MTPAYDFRAALEKTALPHRKYISFPDLAQQLREDDELEPGRHFIVVNTATWFDTWNTGSPVFKGDLDIIQHLSQDQLQRGRVGEFAHVDIYSTLDVEQDCQYQIGYGVHVFHCPKRPRRSFWERIVETIIGPSDD